MQMKITILANKDLASCLALNLLVPRLSGHDLTVFLSARVGGSGRANPELQSLTFFEQTLFNDIVFPALDAGSTAGAELKTFAGIAQAIGGDITELNAVNEEPDLERLRRSQPELLLSIRYGVILREVVIGIPRYGVLNLHSGLLPDYKGVMATFRAMLNGESRIGATLHYINDATIDTGPIVTTTSMPVDPAHSYLRHVLALYDGGCKALAAAVDEITRTGAVEVTPQPPGGNYYSFPTDQELRDFAARGLKLVEPGEIVTLARRFLPGDR